MNLYLRLRLLFEKMAERACRRRGVTRALSIGRQPRWLPLYIAVVCLVEAA